MRPPHGATEAGGATSAAIEDLRRLPDGTVLTADLCLVGSGPAGLTLAGEFARAGVRVLVVESGGLAPDPAVDRLGGIRSTGAPRVLDAWSVRNRVFGGTSHTWNGRCAPFDPIDFACRPWVPFSGWPFAAGTLDDALARARSYLGLAPFPDDEAPPPGGAAGPLRHCLWQYSRDRPSSRDYRRFGPAFLSTPAPDTRVLLQANVDAILAAPDGRAVRGVSVRALNGVSATVHARVVVLCAGGIENARLLLLPNADASAGLGDGRAATGRFLMDHPRTVIGTFPPETFARLRDHYGLFRPPGSTGVFSRGLVPSAASQERDGLLNAAAWITEHRAADDPWDAAKRLVSGRSPAAAQDLWSVVSRPGTIARGLDDRLRRRRGLPHRLRGLTLDCIVEQAPDPDSRITLAVATDALGLPVASVHWRIGEAERRTASSLASAIAAVFPGAGLPAPALTTWIARGEPDAASFTDVAHPTGSTRMGTDPRTSVVDPDARVHGVANLFVAGSSVFPTSGHANPTLMIVALAIRLADHLKRTVFAR